MFLSIEVTDFHNFSSPEYIYDFEVERYRSQEEKALNDLSDYLLDSSSTLDGDEIQKHLFPNKEVDIFLSHSHADADSVIRLAIALERKGLNVFIDSCVWGNAFDLLKDIDNKYCYDSSTSTYSYEKRNRSTSHAYMMLNTALNKMIDNCEVFLFLGTPNSVSVRQGIESQESVNSPWILSELALVQHIRRKTSYKQRLKSLTENLGMEAHQPVMDSLDVAYTKPDLDHRITSTALSNLLKLNYLNKVDVFERLYRHLNP